MAICLFTIIIIFLKWPTWLGMLASWSDHMGGPWKPHMAEADLVCSLGAITHQLARTVAIFCRPSFDSESDGRMCTELLLIFFSFFFHQSLNIWTCLRFGSHACVQFALDGQHADRRGPKDCVTYTHATALNLDDLAGYVLLLNIKYNHSGILTNYK